MTNETSPYDFVIADIQAKLDQLNAALEQLKILRAQTQTGAPPPVAAATRPVSEAEIPHDAFFQMTIPEAARKYLAIVKRTKPMNEIIDCVLKGGLKSSAKDVRNSLRSIISRDETFVRVNSEWGLAEWYPALRRDAKKPKPNNGAEAETISERIVTRMRESPESVITANDLAQHTGAPVATVRASLSTLVKDGKVHRVGIGQYSMLGSESESDSND
jgi:hypothetical protein